VALADPGMRWWCASETEPSERHPHVEGRGGRWWLVMEVVRLKISEAMKRSAGLGPHCLLPPLSGAAVETYDDSPPAARV
jgi:hypothetical protein